MTVHARAGAARSLRRGNATGRVPAGTLPVCFAVVARLACLAAAALALGCTASGPAVRLRSASAPLRPGPQGSYRVPRFRIGWYDSVRNLDTPQRLAREGFDSVMPYGTADLEDTLAFLAAAQQAGLAVHLAIPRARVLDPTGASLEEFVRQTSGSPAVLDWYLYDEPEYKFRPCPRRLEAAYSRVRSVDPDRNLSIVFMFARLSAAYQGAMDSLWIDYYPVGRRSREFASLRGGLYADRVKAFGARADRYGLPLTLVLQGFGEDEEGEAQFWRRLPTAAETRYMFWASFLARPQEVLYWTLYRTREQWLTQTLLPVVREFRASFPDALEYRPATGFRVSGGEADCLVLGNGRGDLRLLVLNRESEARNLEISAAGGYAFAGPAEGQGRELRCSIGAYGVLLLPIVPWGD